MTTPLRIAVVGAGNIAQNHIAAWLGGPDASLSLVDTDPARAADLCARMNIAPLPIVTSLDAALAQKPDVVHICTPPFLHAPQARAALKAGVHAIVEKPPAASLAELDELIALAKAQSRLALAIIQVRQTRATRQMRALMADGVLGRFLHGTVTTHWRRDDAYYAVAWRGRHATEIGGPLAGLSIHHLDWTLPFIPRPVEVQGRTATLNHAIEVEDCAAALVGLEGGGWLQVSVTTHAHRERTAWLLVYENGEVNVDSGAYGGLEEGVRVTCVDPQRQARADACLAALVETSTPPGIDPVFWRQRCAWVDAIRRGDGAGCDLASLRPTFELITGIYAAARTGARERLPIASDHPQYRRLAP